MQKKTFSLVLEIVGRKALILDQIELIKRNYKEMIKLKMERQNNENLYEGKNSNMSVGTFYNLNPDCFAIPLRNLNLVSRIQKNR